ncbi:STAS domain-containing protein [Nocardia sp. NPDC047648]|uniref:STAS domain-containing protein n=1 Tax=Nocardia sp. NPDC047648 TaxID=3155625 RepID=UPI0033CB0A13
MESPAEPRPSDLERAPASNKNADPRTRLSSSLRRQGPAVVMSTRGTADAFTLAVWCEDIRRAIECAEASSCGLVVDTTKLEFLSCRALLALAREAVRCRGHATAVSLVSPSPTIAKIASADPVIGRLPVHSTVVSALTSLRLHPPRRALSRTARPTAPSKPGALGAAFRNSGKTAMRPGSASRIARTTPPVPDEDRDSRTPE